MDQILIGNYLAKKRKEKNMTQSTLAERLSVSNKTISKWETGKCMPDYSIIVPLCQELDITIAELLDGEDKADKSVRVYDNTQVLDLIKRTQALEAHQTALHGMILTIMGIALFILHYNIGGSNAKDFISGLLLGLSVCELIAGLYVTSKGAIKRK